MDPISGASGQTFPHAYSHTIEGGANHSQTEQTTTDTAEHSDSLQSSSEYEVNQRYVSRATYERQLKRRDQRLENQEQTILGLNRNIVDRELQRSGGQNVETQYNETIQDYVTTETDTDVQERPRLSRRSSRTLRQELAAERQRNAELKEELEAERQRNTNINVDEGQGLRPENLEDQILVEQSPLERIDYYFDSLKTQGSIKKTVVQILTGIALRNKAANRPLSISTDNNAFEIFNMLNAIDFPGSENTREEMTRNELIQHCRIIEECLENIEQESGIIYINEKILSAIKGNFDRNKWGGVQARDNLIESAAFESPDYLGKRHEHNAACIAEKTMLICCILLFLTKSVPQAAPVFDEPCIKQDRKKLKQNLEVLYKKYDGLQLRNINGSPLERFNSYFDSLIDQDLLSLEKHNQVKYAVLLMFAGIVLNSKLSNNPLPELYGENIPEIYANVCEIYGLIDQGVYALNHSDDEYISKESDRWSLSKHYEKIKTCFEEAASRSDIQHVHAKISGEIERIFKNTWRLEWGIDSIIEKDIHYLKNTHNHDENCTVPLNNIFAKMLLPGYNRKVCITTEQKALRSKFNKLHEKYIALQSRETIYPQQMPVQASGHQGESAASPSMQPRNQRIVTIASDTDSVSSQDDAVETTSLLQTRQADVFRQYGSSLV